MMKSLQAYFLIDLKIVLRERMAMVMILLLPAVMYAFFGLLFGSASYGAERNSYYDEYTASFAGLILLNVALMNVGPTFVIYKEMGFFRRLLVTPLDMSAVWLSTIFRAFLIFMLGYVEMLLLGIVMFNRLPATSADQLILSLAVSAFALFSFGFMLGTIFNSTQAAFNAGIVAFQPMLLLSGASFPLDIFPQWVRYTTEFIPMTHVVKVLRLSWRQDLYTQDAVWPITFLIVFGFACALVAHRSFRWSATSGS
jgi:ABC-2 type transport system permease protein